MVLIGTAPNAPGGMSAVVMSYREAGLFELASCDYLSSYTQPGLWNQLRCFGGTLLTLCGRLLRRRVRLLHLNSASRGSFWRKSLLAALARQFGVPYLFHIHSGEFPDFHSQQSSLGKAWIRFTLERAARVLVVTEYWVPVLQKIAPHSKFQVLRNPVQVPVQQPDKSGLREQILFLGRVREKKGAFDLLQAMPALLAVVPSAKLLMAGDGDLDAARALCDTLGIAHAVEFTGWIDGTRKQHAIDSSGTFVLPSHFEAISVGILEAMAQGLVVVASRVGGIPDLVRDGSNGLLVPVHALDTLAGTLARIILEPAECERLTRQAFQDVQAYEMKAVVQSLLGIYAEVQAEQGH